MKVLVAALAVVVVVIGVTRWLAAGTEPVTVDRIGDQVQTLPRGRTPMFADTPDVVALYRFAAGNPDVLRFIPCMCGCGDPSIGHTSNRMCYIKDEPPGRVTFTSHAAT